MSAPELYASPRTGDSWETVVGLEVHVQLGTRTKLFCRCANAFGGRENSRICPVCTGQPGAMPALNREAVALGVRAALALGCDVAPSSKFDRKNYFYCDLPKGYQTSQLDQPLSTGGRLELVGGGSVGVTRIHLEEDAGKAIHDRGDATLVDLNRAGIPLIECVSEPDIRSAEQAGRYLRTLRENLVYAGVSDCDMEKGSLRCDVNVSVRPPGEALRTKVEIKNLNSFRNVQAAIEHEVERQVEAYESGDPDRAPVQETRLFDPDRGVTRTMRSKEDAQDYRYFPEPDLPAVVVSPAEVEAARDALPELPLARRARYVDALGLSEYDAGVLTAERDVADFFEAAAGASGKPKECANWIANEVLRALGDDELAARAIGELPIRPTHVADLVGLVAASRISSSAGREVIRHMLATGDAAEAAVAALGLEQIDDDAELERLCREALVGRDAVIAEVKGGKEKALGAVIGPVMKASGGRANPQRVREILLRLVHESD